MKKAKGPKESVIQAAILAHLRSIPGVFAKKMDVGYIPGRASAIKGIPDILVIIRPGHVWFLEVKRPGEKPTPEQVEFMAGWKACGGNCAVVHSVEEVIALVPLPQLDMFSRLRG